MGKVVDLSQFNEVSNFIKVKAAVDAVILRLGYRGAHTGTITYDPKYQEYMAACQKNGIPTMIYFFPCSITKAEAEAEANFIISAAKKVNLCGPIWLDSEVVYRNKSGRSDKLGKADRTKYLNVILRKLHDAGYKCGVYASMLWFAGNLNDNDLEPYCMRWVAQWADQLTYTGHGVALWQYTNNGSVDGINGRVDMSRCYIALDGSQGKQATQSAVTRQDIVRQICSWEGYSESNGKHKLIVDIYNYYLPTAVKSGTLNYKVKYNDAWCATAASAAYIQAGAPELFPIECGCPRNITLAKKMGIWQEADNYVPDLADAVLYDWQDSGSGDNTGTADHIGIVISVDKASGTFVVMEGNAGNGVVTRRNMKINGKYIRGFITPKFVPDTNVGNKPAQTATKKEEIKTVAKNIYEVSKTGTPNKTTCIKWGLLKHGQRVTARVQPQNGAKPCSFSLVQPLTKIEVYDYITTVKRWAYCKVGNKYGFILATSIADYLRIPKQPMDTVVKQVIAGDFGNGDTRVKALKTLGYDATAVQAEVDKRLAPKPKTGWAKVLSILESIMSAKDPHKRVIEILKKHGHTLKESEAWCSETVVAAFLEAGLPAIIGGYAADAPTLKRHAKALGIWHSGDSGIKTGDIVLYGGDAPNHTEIAIDGTYNISGNYSGTVKKRKRAGRTIHGYIRPKYPDAKESG